MGCCGKVEEDEGKNPESPISKDRKCTDILFLVLFIAFWVGMLYVGSIAFTDGNPDRIQFGIDSYGNLCGSKNDYLGQPGPDLRDRKKLYYLDPYEIVSAGSEIATKLISAKRICVDRCPSDVVCGLDQVPCRNASVYHCPYYRVAEGSVYGNLPSGAVDDWDTNYYDQLFNADPAACGTELLDLFNGVPSFIQDQMGTALSGACGLKLQATSAFPGQGPCYPAFLKTHDVLNFCIPYGASTGTSELGTSPPSPPSSDGGDRLDQKTYDEIVNVMNDMQLTTVQRYVADVGKGWVVVVVAGLIGGMTVSLVWMTVLRFCAGCMAWTTVIIVNLLFWAVTVLLFSKAGVIGDIEVARDYYDQVPQELQSGADTDRETFLYSAYAAAGLSAVLLLVTLLMYRRIKVAVACIKVASQAVASMPSILLFPILPFAMLLCMFVYWLVVMAYLYSAGEVTEVWDIPQDDTSGTDPASLAMAAGTPCAETDLCYFTVTWDDPLRYMMLYHLFGLLWTTQFIIGFGYTVVAGAIANFYWSRGDARNMPLFPVLGSLRRTCRYHLGSIAFGSFIVAVIQFVRIMLEYLDRKTKELQEGNVLLKYAMCCVKYCMWYLEKVVKFINKNAYILVAVKGTSYCASAQRAVSLIISNALRLAAVNTVGDLLIWLARLGTALMCGVIAFLLTDLPQYTDNDKYPETYLTSPYLVIFLSVLIAYFVANLFFEVYEMAVDTVLLSFCEDCERSDGNPQFAPPLLLAAIGKSRAAGGGKVEDAR